MGLRNRLQALITSKHLVVGIFMASLAESTVVPIPLEAVLIPALQVNRERLWLLTSAALGGCLLGALLGYAIGYWLFDAIGSQLIGWFGDGQQYQQALAEMRKNGFWFVLSVGIVPIPFQLAMLAAGAVRYPLVGYMAATLIARSIRYFGLAFLVWKFGDQAHTLYERHKRTSIALVTLVVAAVWGVVWWMKD